MRVGHASAQHFSVASLYQDRKYLNTMQSLGIHDFTSPVKPDREKQYFSPSLISSIYSLFVCISCPCIMEAEIQFLRDQGKICLTVVCAIVAHLLKNDSNNSAFSILFI